MRRAPLAVASMAVLATACGSVPVAVPVGGGEPVPVSQQPGPTFPGTQGPGTSGPGQTPTAAPTTLRERAGGGSTAERAPEYQGDFDIAVEVIPLCVAAGTSGLARVTTRPNVGLALLVSFVADPERAGPWTFGTADPSGRYEWTFALPPDAPAGPADVLVGAGDWDRGDGATGREPFDVGDPTC